MEKREHRLVNLSCQKNENKSSRPDSYKDFIVNGLIDELSKKKTTHWKDQGLFLSFLSIVVKTAWEPLNSGPCWVLVTLAVVETFYQDFEM